MNVSSFLRAVLEVNYDSERRVKAAGDVCVPYPKHNAILVKLLSYATTIWHEKGCRTGLLIFLLAAINHVKI